MIISASRRTDIPAFYSAWFINRVREGFLIASNPFNPSQFRRVSLEPRDVDAIVFWSRNPEALIPYLPDLDARGLKYYFQFTITGYPRTIERAVPDLRRAVATFWKLSDLIGPEKVIWRYDPILLSNLVDLDTHKSLFTQIAGLLRHKTKKVVISFADFYQKTRKNLGEIEGARFEDIVVNENEAYRLVEFLAQVAREHELEIESCSEKMDLSALGVKHGKCIDDELLNRLFGLKVSPRKDDGQRRECGCVKSVDIGQYNTCAHQCAYCYATDSPSAVAANMKLHDPRSPCLIGGAEGIDPELLKPSAVQLPLLGSNESNPRG